MKSAYLNASPSSQANPLKTDQKLIIVAHRDLAREAIMQRMFLASVTIALGAVSAAVVFPAQASNRRSQPRKVTDNVYYFRYQGHQSMFS